MSSGSGPLVLLTFWMRMGRRIAVAAVGIAAVAALAPGAATSAKRDAVVSWSGQTPGEGVTLGVAAKTQLSVPLAAESATPALTIRIRSTSGSPQGAKLQYKDGNPARATFTWTPAKSQIGVYHVTFTAGPDVPPGGGPRNPLGPGRPPQKAPPGAGAPPGAHPPRHTPPPAP